jgi:ankyrin repeat protein
VNARDVNGETALFRAGIIEENRPVYKATVEALVKGGIDTEAKDTKGRTAGQLYPETGRLLQVR